MVCAETDEPIDSRFGPDADSHRPEEARVR